jgi:hypothetical protein
MYNGKLIFSQLTSLLPWYEFRKCVSKYNGDYKVKDFTCREHFLVMSFAQLTYRESLRDIEACLRSQSKLLYHCGVCSGISRNNLSNANNVRNWCIYADFAQVLLKEAKELYANDDFGFELKNSVYALDSSVIDLCLSVFPWANYMTTKSAIKLHTVLDLRGNLPSIVIITDGKISDMAAMDFIPWEAGSIYIMDRGYLDYKRLYEIERRKAFFVSMTTSNMKLRRVYSNKVDKKQGIICDQSVRFVTKDALKNYPDKFRRIKYKDIKTGESLAFITNNFEISAITIADLYKARWRIEIFFKWIKQNLRIKSFYGTSENAVKCQIWIAIATYLMVAIAKKKLHIEQSIYTFLQVISVNIFQKTRLSDLFSGDNYKKEHVAIGKQLNLFF